MYLMNVPPVAAIHSEWRSSCVGPPRGFSGLPLCFNDSDSDLSTTGTPIPEKVQMIIESLRSTQSSSLDMGDEMDLNQVLPGQPGQEAGARSSQGQGFKARRGPPVVTGPSPKLRGPLPPTHSDVLLALPEVSSDVDSASQSADSDDSSDGIEEAIQEYLKEKDDHKRKAEPEAAANILQPPKTPRREAPLTVPEPPETHSDSNKVLTAINQVPRSVKTHTQFAVPPPVKKLVKSKTPTFKENPFNKIHTSRAAVVKKLASFEKRRGPSNTYLLSDKLKCPGLDSKSKRSMKLEEHLSDSDSSSSSDDGIEEAIQRYQQEKSKGRHEGRGKQSTKPPRLLKEEADSSSSSNDGIEEAIRRYQLEKQKEKSVPKQKQVSKGAVTPENTNTQPSVVKKHKLSKKKKKKPDTGDLKSSLPFHTPGSSLTLIKNRLPASSSKGNLSLLSTKAEPLKSKERELDATPGPATLKVNSITTTTAELLCAEAILDISKAVIKMPETFSANAAAGLLSISGSSTETATATSLLISSNRLDDGRKSEDESSIDSEDGIEQEIRKFLEQKAQMHKPSPGTDSAVGTSPDGMITEAKHPKLSPLQKKTIRLSLTQKKRLKDEGKSGAGSIEDGEMKGAVAKTLTEHDRESSLSVSDRKGTPQSDRASERRREPTGDKSSSLDSDEDLDTAIKDLLKTKKKLKKTRDKKTPLALRSLKPEPKPTSLLKTSLKDTPTSPSAHSMDDRRKKSKTGKNVSSHPPINKTKEFHNQGDETDRAKVNRGVEGLSVENSPVVVQIKEDSSSVDSDDSIELEIRKFLAEKAKVSTVAVTTSDRQDVENGSGKTTVAVMEKCIKSENQLAEISSMDVTRSSETPSRTSPEHGRKNVGRGVLPNTAPVLTNQGNPNLTTSDTARGPCLVLPLTPSFYPPALEPANGTVSGAARAEKRRRSSSGSGSSDAHQSASSEMARVHNQKSIPSPSTSLPRTDSEQRRTGHAVPSVQTKEKIHKRNPFQYRSPTPSLGEKPVRTAAYQSSVPAGMFDHKRSAETAARPDALVSPCSTVVRTGSTLRTPIAPFHRPSSLETTSTSAAVFSSPFPSLTRRPSVMGPSGRYFLHGHGSGSASHWGVSPTRTPGQLEGSVVHVAKDQATYVELATNKTNHVQVRSREEKGAGAVSTGQRERKGEKGRESRMAVERGGEQIGRQEEECVDETDVSETDERTSPGKKQGFPALSLSSAIDPGITLSPYIALSTEERSKRFSWMCCTDAGRQPMKTRIEKPVKRKLQFLPLSRKTESSAMQLY
ncbi:hypothetical protein DPEC_G00322470 [Dallia pectoralis]|uniref:Uncharacterized protein n=1 Tax=Dallia pectoralis TaxID=75939 RepID=A0ACC2FAG3_DALPE|nr:hypothetical protein DPEC_G00322470 [Dallia pectoralis]